MQLAQSFSRDDVSSSIPSSLDAQTQGSTPHTHESSLHSFSHDHVFDPKGALSECYCVEMFSENDRKNQGAKCSG